MHSMLVTVYIVSVAVDIDWLVGDTQYGNKLIQKPFVIILKTSPLPVSHSVCLLIKYKMYLLK